MGYSEEKVRNALQYLKKQKNYTPVGEVERAMDLIQKEIEQELKR